MHRNVNLHTLLAYFFTQLLIEAFCKGSVYKCTHLLFLLFACVKIKKPVKILYHNILSELMKCENDEH